MFSCRHLTNWFPMTTLVLAAFAGMFIALAAPAGDPVVEVDCLCVSTAAGAAEGMTDKTWEELIGALKRIIRNDLVVSLSPIAPPGERQKQACLTLTEMMGAHDKPYTVSESPVTIEFLLLTKHTTVDDYESSLFGALR